MRNLVKASWEILDFLIAKSYPDVRSHEVPLWIVEYENETFRVVFSAHYEVGPLHIGLGSENGLEQSVSLSLRCGLHCFWVNTFE